MTFQHLPTEGSAWLSLTDKVCVVTGAASGIGAELARRFAAAGARVALFDRDLAQATSLAAQLTQQGAHALAVQCDISQAASVDTAATVTHARLGRCDILINNATVVYVEALMDIDLDRWNQLMSVNLAGYLLCAQVFGRQMITSGGGGSMLHIASISGSHPQPFGGAYSVSKAGIKMLSKMLAAELGPHGIRSNVISPAMVRTPMSESIYLDAAVLRQREKLVPAGRIGTAVDIAEAALFLASPRASYINGVDLAVDGGLDQAWMGMIPRPGFEK